MVNANGKFTQINWYQKQLLKMEFGQATMNYTFSDI